MLALVPSKASVQTCVCVVEEQFLRTRFLSSAHNGSLPILRGEPR